MNTDDSNNHDVESDSDLSETSHSDDTIGYVGLADSDRAVIEEGNDCLCRF